MRKLQFEDEMTTSPVLGLKIKEGPLEQKPRSQCAGGDKPLGEFVCQLCREAYADPFSLAQHKCSRIVRIEYRCPECDKLFSCPANLASHRRWHKPKPGNPESNKTPAPEKEHETSSDRDTPSPGLSESGSEDGLMSQERHIRLQHSAQVYPCKYCPAMFYSSPGLTRHINKCHPSENRQVILLQMPVRPAC
ncbi:hypothetical protein PO909_010125 [Leuciscus waleckii]